MHGIFNIHFLTEHDLFGKLIIRFVEGSYVYLDSTTSFNKPTYAASVASEQIFSSDLQNCLQHHYSFVRYGQESFSIRSCKSFANRDSVNLNCRNFVENVALEETYLEGSPRIFKYSVEQWSWRLCLI